jgi:hypothetical protein
MATKTATLARSTEVVAKLTEQDVALSRTALEADVRPVLIAVPPAEFVHERGLNYDVRVPGTGAMRGSPDRAAVWVQDVDNLLFVSAPFRNEGAGIAFDLEAWLEWNGEKWAGETPTDQIPPHEFSRASFGIPSGDSRPTFERVAETGGVFLKVRYSDLAGNIWLSHIDLEPTSDALNDWRVGSVWVTGEGRLEPAIRGRG